MAKRSSSVASSSASSSCEGSSNILGRRRSLEPLRNDQALIWLKIPKIQKVRDDISWRMEAQERKNKFEKVPNTEFQIHKKTDWVDKAPRPSISNVIWVLSSDTICQLNQLFSNSEVAMLSMTEVLWEMLNRLSSRIKVNCLSHKISLNFTMYNALVYAS